MRRDIATMTRRELFLTGRVLVAIGTGAVAIMAATGLVASNDATWPGFVWFVCVWPAAGGLFGGGYYLLRGALRSADWRPSPASLAIADFDPAREQRKLVAMLQKELAKLDVGTPRTWHRVLGNDRPVDRRSGFRQFVESSEPLHEQHVIEAVVSIDGRELVVAAYVARGADRSEALWSRVTFRTACRWPESEPVSWDPRRGFHGRAPVTTPEITKLLGVVINGSVHWGSRLVGHPDPRFEIRSEATGSYAFADTLPREVLGGFSWRLGVGEFLRLVEALEDSR